MLVTCAVCGRIISHATPACPGCGHPPQSVAPVDEEKAAWIAFLAAAGWLLVALACVIPLIGFVVGALTPSENDWQTGLATLTALSLGILALHRAGKIREQ